MKKLFLIPLLLILICWNKNESYSFMTKSNIEKDTVITIIFKGRTFKGDTLRRKTGEYSFNENNLNYSVEGSSLEHELSPKNYKKNDTVKISTDKDIILFHRFYVRQYSLYTFKPGDTVMFEYPNEYPVCKVVNRKFSDADLNFMTELNMKTRNSLKTESEFFLENKRWRTPAEKKIFDKEYIGLCSFKERKIDSLKSIMNPKIYELNKTDLKYNMNPVESFSLNKPFDLSIPSGRNLILGVFSSIHKAEFIKSSNGSIPDYRKLFNDLLSLQNIDVVNKDYLMYYFLDNIAQSFSADDFIKYFKLFEKAVADKSLIVEIKKQYPQLFQAGKSDNTGVYLLDLKNKKLELKQIIEANKGKVIYIDFWASWCGPCRAAMPFSEKLRQEYKDKDVVFIYISTDKEFEKWKTASQKEKLSNLSNNYLAVNYPNALYYKELQLKTIPRYLIYNKKGKLIHRDAPGSEGEEIRKELDKYLAE